MQKWLAMGVVVFWFGAGPAVASHCTPGLPLGDGDDTGIASCNSKTVACERGTAFAMGKAMCGILSCHKKQANHAVNPNSKTVPEEPCEDTALTRFVTKAMQAQTKGGAPCGCIDIAGLRNLIEMTLDTTINSALYCAPGPPIDPSGDDLGTLGTPPEVKRRVASVPAYARLPVT